MIFKRVLNLCVAFVFGILPDELGFHEIVLPGFPTLIICMLWNYLAWYGGAHIMILLIWIHNILHYKGVHLKLTKLWFDNWWLDLALHRGHLHLIRHVIESISLVDDATLLLSRESFYLIDLAHFVILSWLEVLHSNVHWVTLSLWFDLILTMV